MKTYKNLFNKIVDPEALFIAWDEFKSNKRGKDDVQEFEKEVEQNIFQLASDLKNKTYRHGPYTGFYIYDPKRRHIHKATVRDRVLHHAIFKVVNEIFEPTFISHSFSCRIGKGTHRGVAALDVMIRKATRNYTIQRFALKCDIRKFFDSIDHRILLDILKTRIRDPDFLWLLEEIVESFQSDLSNLFQKRGLPIGNLTSQIFANVYMNELDQFVKHKMKLKYYARYTDDFVIVGHSEAYLQEKLGEILSFLDSRLALSLHPDKIIIRKCGQGIDFLGYVVFPHHILIRGKTRKRIFRKLREKVKLQKSGRITEDELNQSLQSYLGVLSNADSHKLREQVLNHFWFWLRE
jgi:retron-type reverse transcriptase